MGSGPRSSSPLRKSGDVASPHSLGSTAARMAGSSAKRSFGGWKSLHVWNGWRIDGYLYEAIRRREEGRYAWRSERCGEEDCFPFDEDELWWVLETRGRGGSSNKLSAMLRLVAYPGQGIAKSIPTAVKSRTPKLIAVARHEEGQYLLKGPIGSAIDRAQALAEFNHLIGKE